MESKVLFSFKKMNCENIVCILTAFCRGMNELKKNYSIMYFQ